MPSLFLTIFWKKFSLILCLKVLISVTVFSSDERLSSQIIIAALAIMQIDMELSRTAEKEKFIELLASLAT